MTKLPNIGGTNVFQANQRASNQHQGLSGDTTKHNSIVRESHISGIVFDVSANVTGRKRRTDSRLRFEPTRDASGNLMNLNSDLSDDNEAMLRSKNFGGHRKSKSYMKNSIDSQGKLRMSDKRS